MCGIVGYVGHKNASEVLLNGLKRLEYRGYDSAGIALNCGGLVVKKRQGKINELIACMDYSAYDNCLSGIGHTRWATHGEPNEVNAHPHTDCTGGLALVHNGIIENYNVIKEALIKEGHVFKSETDSEVIVHLIEYYYKNETLVDAVLYALQRIEGAYGIAVISDKEPDRIVAARKGSPLIVGVGDNEMMLASDSSAIVEHTRNVIYLEDGEVVEITSDGIKTYDTVKRKVSKPVETIDWDIEQIEKQGYEHFMLKEICEQPETIHDSFRGRILIDYGNAKLDGLRFTDEDFKNLKKIIFVACGTSWHAALIGEYLIEEYARIPVEVQYASEFRYRKPILSEGDYVISISQSGETADTLAALREAKARGVKVLGITNVVGSTIARESDAGVYLHAGPEIGVASTKAFTSQITVLILLMVLLARRRDMTAEEGRAVLKDLMAVPENIEKIVNDNTIEELSELYCNSLNFLYLGRGIQFPVALEGALKLKEISYIHAEGYPAAEMKHGPIALIDENMPVVFLALKDEIYSKILSSMEEVKARRGKIIAIATEGDTEIKKYADHVVYVPETNKIVSPLLSVVPLQLMAYYMAKKRGCDVDQPRNLAKSVTVE